MHLSEPYVLTTDELVRFKLNLLDLKEGEELIDLGCGNAQVLVEAAKMKKIKGIGYELLPEAVSDALKNISDNDLHDQIEIITSNFNEADVSNADAIILYLTRFSLGEISLKLENELKPGARIVTHDFDIPAWKEEEKHEFKDAKGAMRQVYLYRVSK